MAADLLTAISDTLDASFAEEPRRQKRRTRDEAPAGPLWSRDVPGSKEIVAHVIEFTKRGCQLEFELNDLPLAYGKIDNISAGPNGLTVSYTKSFLSGVKTHDTAFLAYPNPKIAALCQGKSVQYGRATVQIKGGDLTFDAMYEGGAAVVKFAALRVGFRGFFRTWWSGVERFVLGPDTGEVVLDNWVNFFLPTLVWKPLSVTPVGVAQEDGQ